MALTLDAALARLPEKSPFRAALTALVSPDPKEHAKASQALEPYHRPHWQAPKPLAEAEALAALEACLGLEFPPLRDEHDHGSRQVLMTLMGSAHPSLLDLVEARFATTPAAQRLDLLTLVASAGTMRGARLLRTLLETCGWPIAFHDRFFIELGRNVPHAAELMPALLDLEGGPLVDLGDFALRGLRSGTLPPERLAAAKYCADLGGRITGMLRVRPEIAATDPNELFNLDGQLGMALDFAGFIGDAKVVDALRAALEGPEARPVMFAASSLLRRKEAVPDAVLARLAADASLRAWLYSLLAEANATERIPPQFRTRDAFAAADITHWLAHPNELGHPPEALEQMAVFEAGEQVLYVWRFRARNKWMAALSGPYPVRPPEGPLSGEATFSRFEAWEKRDAEGHAKAVLDTLKSWKRA